MFGRPEVGLGWRGASLDHRPRAVRLGVRGAAQRFDVAMNTSGTADPANDDQKSGGLNSRRESGLVLDHPITIGRDPSERINRVVTFYGQAAHRVPWGARRFCGLRIQRTMSPRTGILGRGMAQGVALELWRGPGGRHGRSRGAFRPARGAGPMGMNVPESTTARWP